MNIPKKLRDTFDNYQFVELMEKINELIDYLESKQTTHVCNCCEKDVNKTSNGKCSKCGVEYPIHKGDCSELYPPEHEESFIPTLTKWQRGQLDKHYVSKEKIKREIGELEVPPENLHASAEENNNYYEWIKQGHEGYLYRNEIRRRLLNSLGLGD